MTSSSTTGRAGSPARTLTRAARLMAVATVVGIVAVGCGSSKSSSSSSGTTPGGTAPTSLGKGEGALNIIAWAGYAENGSNDPKVNWVGPFEQQTGCKVNVKIGNTSDEMVQLMKTGQYDGVSASGDADLRLIYGGDVAPVNTALVPNYKSLSPFLKMTPYNSVNGVAYGIPHGWGANLLMWNTKVVTTAPDSWGAVFGKTSPYKGKVTAYDSPIYIADAALYLMKTQPSLGIKNPYALNQTQFDAAIALLKTQKANVGEYWSDYLKAADAFEKGSLVMGTTWQVIANTIRRHQGRSGADGAAEGGLHRLVRHLDGVVQGQAPELHVQVDELHHQPVGAGPGRPVLRRGPGQPAGVHHRGGRVLLAVPRHRRRVRREALLLDHAHQGVPRRQRQDGLRELPAVDAGVERPARLVIA